MPLKRPLPSRVNQKIELPDVALHSPHQSDLSAMPSKALPTEMSATAAPEDGTRTKGHRMYYPSNVTNRLARNAVTGAEYSWTVGSEASRTAFRIIDASGRCDKDGYLLRRVPRGVQPRPGQPGLTDSRAPNQCYYDSPHEYERHMGVTLPEDVTERWKREHSESEPVKVAV